MFRIIWSYNMVIHLESGRLRNFFGISFLFYFSCSTCKACCLFDSLFLCVYHILWIVVYSWHLTNDVELFLSSRPGISTPGMSSSLAYFGSYRRERLPSNLVQAQIDYFGAHTDVSGSFHTECFKIAKRVQNLIVLCCGLMITIFIQLYCFICIVLQLYWANSILICYHVNHPLFV